jgi:hypothetical protein
MGKGRGGVASSQPSTLLGVLAPFFHNLRQHIEQALIPNPDRKLRVARHFDLKIKGNQSVRGGARAGFMLRTPQALRLVSAV